MIRYIEKELKSKGKGQRCDHQKMQRSKFKGLKCKGQNNGIQKSIGQKGKCQKKQCPKCNSGDCIMHASVQSFLLIIGVNQENL